MSERGEELEAPKAALDLGLQLALAADATGRVTMTIAELMRRTGWGRCIALQAGRDLVRIGLLSRVGTTWAWQARTVIAFAAEVLALDAQHAAPKAPRIGARALGREVLAERTRQVVRIAEREVLRARAASARYKGARSLSQAPRPDALERLSEWAIAFAEHRYGAADPGALAKVLFALGSAYFASDGRLDKATQQPILVSRRHPWSWLPYEIEALESAVAKKLDAADRKRAAAAEPLPAHASPATSKIDDASELDYGAIAAFGATELLRRLGAS